MAGCLTVVRPGLTLPEPARGETVVRLDEVQGWLKSGGSISRLLRYDRSRILVHRLESAGRPLPLALALRWMTRGAVRIEDVRGRARVVDVATLARWVRQTATEPFKINALLRRVEHEVRGLEKYERRLFDRLDLSKPPLYLRSDLSFGVRAGGSVGHIAGVVNNLDAFGPGPIFLTTDDVPTVRTDVESHVIEPSTAFWNFRELPMLALNDSCEAAAEQALDGRRIGFVYQRYSLNNYSGVALARRHGVPFVLEYNGSEVWVGRHWGRPLRYEALATRIERLNIAAADLVVVVSRVLSDQVAAAGVDRRRILVNPNGVDPDRYRPDVDGSRVREQYGLSGKLVIGFIGTFGPWHGAEMLARSFAALRADAGGRAKTTLLMIGDGATLPATKSVLAEAGAGKDVVFTGLVPQERGPEYLAACDILVAPHVPNPDGTPFFGSPTKLFEYMAMGRAIVASRLDQIGEVIEHGRTGWLVEPANVEALAAGLRTLLDDSNLRARLGAAARACALERYTWRSHTKRTLDALQDVVGERN